jgi:hypothetical protein
MASAAGGAAAARRAAAVEAELCDARREAAEERARADALQDRVWELQGLLKQSQENYDALVRARRIVLHAAWLRARAQHCARARKGANCVRRNALTRLARLLRSRPRATSKREQLRAFTTGQPASAAGAPPPPPSYPPPGAHSAACAAHASLLDANLDALALRLRPGAHHGGGAWHEDEEADGVLLRDGDDYGGAAPGWAAEGSPRRWGPAPRSPPPPAQHRRRGGGARSASPQRGATGGGRAAHARRTGTRLLHIFRFCVCVCPSVGRNCQCAHADAHTRTRALRLPARRTRRSLAAAASASAAPRVAASAGGRSAVVRSCARAAAPARGCAGQRGHGRVPGGAAAPREPGCAHAGARGRTCMRHVYATGARSFTHAMH